MSVMNYRYFIVILMTIAIMAKLLHIFNPFYYLEEHHDLNLNEQTSSTIVPPKESMTFDEAKVQAIQLFNTMSTKKNHEEININLLDELALDVGDDNKDLDPILLERISTYNLTYIHELKASGVHADCTKELLDFELQENIHPSLRALAQLLLAWQLDSKNILFAGDSLLMQFTEMLKCSAILLGAEVERTSTHRYGWTKEDVQYMQSEEILDGYSSLSGKANTETQAVVIKYDFTFPDGSEFSFDYLRFYKMVSESFIGDELSFLFDDLQHPAPLQKSHGFQLVSESLCDISDKRRYDKIYLNSGHMAYYPPARQRAFVTESIANLDALKRCASKLVFLDHPPQNFYFREGGNYPQNWNFRVPRCDCEVDYTKQDSEINNLALQRLTKERGISYKRFFGGMSEFCMFHRSWKTDCTHYYLSPTVWGSLTQSLLEDYYWIQEGIRD